MLGFPSDSTPIPKADEAICVAVDAMGGDHAPRSPVLGAVRAVSRTRNERPLRVCLVGDEARIREIMSIADVPRNCRDRIDILPASQVIGMDESPSTALEKKKDASMLVGIRAVKEGRVEALVSAGNTGALMAGSLLTLGRIPGIRRPAIAVLWPTAEGRPLLLLDAGANAECKPEYYLQFAQMGTVYMERVLGRMRPRTGLLNIGGEATKGGTHMTTVFGLLEKSGLNFIGNVEPADLFKTGLDVAVTDGFVGNMVLKTGEATAEMIMSTIKREVSESVRMRLAALVMRPIFSRLKKKVDHSEYGGAPLLGIQGIVIKSHGRADELTIANAVHVAARAVEREMVDHISEAIRTVKPSEPAASEKASTV